MTIIDLDCKLNLATSQSSARERIGDALTANETLNWLARNLTTLYILLVAHRRDRHSHWPSWAAGTDGIRRVRADATGAWCGVPSGREGRGCRRIVGTP